MPWFAAVLTATLALICAIVAVLLMDSRTAVRQRASDQAANLSAVLALDIARNIEFLDLSIQGVIDDLAMPEVGALPAKLRRLVLFDRAATAPYLGSLRVLDAAGNIVVDSLAEKAPAINFADRDYFRVHAVRRNLGLYISVPLISRTDGRRIIALSRRIDRADGSFGGVVVGTVYLDYLHNLFTRTKLGANGSLTLFRTDGTVIMREPYSDVVGKTVRSPDLFQRLAASDEGEYVGRSVVDGVQRLIHYRKLAGVPLVQNAALAVDDIYAEWWRRAIGITGVTALCCAIIIALAIRLRRELRRRSAAEAALVLLADEDGLTGLANRRRFDETLRIEWNRAARHATTMSLLMIDVDHFKAFNDRLGHLAGDRALAAIGACLRANSRQSGELAARYGGEEFAVILPMADTTEAAKLAERLQAAILDLAIAHPASPTGTVTVSIGIATAAATMSADRLDLVASADAALYQAKSAGRNRISTWAMALNRAA